MIVIYVLKSEKNEILYVGMTENLNRRIKEHNAAKCKFTSGHMPWKLIYYESAENFEKARKREKYLKSAAGKLFIRKRMNE